jgi:hypothetical protein
MLLWTFYESVQILAYADDTDIIGINQSARIEAFTSSEKAAKNLNLLINQEHTNDRPVTRNSHASSPSCLEHLDSTNPKLFIISLT